MHARFSRRTRYGFTLLELIVGLVVIGVLAALAVPRFSAVRARSALEVEEAGLAAIARAAYAHAKLGDATATSYTAADLEAVTASDQAAESLQLRRPGRRIRTGLGEFSTSAQAIHASIRPDGTVGLAVYVPQAAACAYGHAARPDRGFAVDTWSVKGAAVFECAGNVAAGGPSGSAIGLMAPPTPSGLTVAGGLASWDADAAVATWDVWCAGEHLGETTTTSFDVGSCDPDDVLVSARASGSSQPGWEGGPSTVDPAPREIGGSTGSDGTTGTATASSDGAVTVSWDDPDATAETTYTVERSTDGGQTWETVATDATGSSYLDRTAPVDTTISYRVAGPSGPVTTTASTPTPPTSPTGSSSSDGSDGWLAVEMSGADATLSWLAVDDIPQAPLDGYRLYRSRNAGDDWTLATRVYDGAATTHVDRNLASGTWCWRVSAYGPGGESGMSTPACSGSWTLRNTSTGPTGTAQTWTAPETGTYRITAAGAAGGLATCYAGTPGLGATAAGDIALQAGQQLKVLVGQRGSNWCYHGGGGGGTFVATSGNAPLIVAGGGAGTDGSTQAPWYAHGQSGTSGGPAKSTTSRDLGGGGGFHTDGVLGDAYKSRPGKGFVNGGAGGVAYGNNGGAGGFGGGSSGYAGSNAGAGGGYSGGNSGSGGNGGDAAYEQGGGGGSYTSGANRASRRGVNDGHGYVTITVAG